jgi:hypothetical protein
MAKKNQVSKTQTPDKTASAEAAPATVARRRVTVPNPNLPQIYANGFQIAVGPLDVRIILIETIPVSNFEVQDRQIASIIISPETLKLLAESLPRYIGRYEKKFGKIRDVNFALSSPDNAEDDE